MGLISDQVTKVLQATWCGQNFFKKRKFSKFDFGDGCTTLIVLKTVEFVHFKWLSYGRVNDISMLL